MSDFARLRAWLRRAAPRRYDLIKALFMASASSMASTGLFVGAVSLLVVSSQRPGLRAIAVILIAIELMAFLRSPLRFAERMSTHRLGFAAVTHWRSWLMRVVGGWDFGRWQRYGTGDLLERSLSDTEELQDLWLRGVIPSVATVATMVLSDGVVALLAPLPRWWAVALTTAVLQLMLIGSLASRLSAHVRADRQLRVRRGAYVASLVSASAAAPEIELLGATDFLQLRDDDLVAALEHAEQGVQRARHVDALIVLVGPIASLGVLAWLHPPSASVWIIVAVLVAGVTFDALLTLRSALYVAVAVTGGAERLDELESPPLAAGVSWPDDHTLAFRDVEVATSPEGSRRVSGQIAPRRRVGISGPSGSGKSTLLRALARLDALASGHVTVGSIGISSIREGELRRHITLVPSEPGLLVGYVRDVVGMGLTIGDEEIASLVALGIDVHPNDAWDELSRGERQRVAIVRALARHPHILLLDEPTSALGDVETTDVLTLLSKVPATVIIASHDPRVLAWCDDVIDLSGFVTA